MSRGRRRILSELFPYLSLAFHWRKLGTRVLVKERKGSERKYFRGIENDSRLKSKFSSLLRRSRVPGGPGAGSLADRSAGGAGRRSCDRSGRKRLKFLSVTGESLGILEGSPDRYSQGFAV